MCGPAGTRGQTARPRACCARAGADLRANRGAGRGVRVLRKRVLQRRQPRARQARALLRARAGAPRRAGSRHADARDTARARARHGAVACTGGGASAQTVAETMEGRERDGALVIRPLSAARVDDVKHVMSGTWGATCWDLYPRFTEKQQRERGLSHAPDAKRRAELARLARRRRAPGLVGYRRGEPIGWVAIGPRFDFARIDVSRATPPVDDVAVWVIPCITVRRRHRGRGGRGALLPAPRRFAGKHGAPAVEAYPRADAKRGHDDFPFYGTAAMFRKAGLRQARRVLTGLPKSWTPRVTMRAPTAPRPTVKRPQGGRGGSARKRAAPLARPRSVADARARTPRV